MSCRFANIFGKPKDGAHSYRILDIAIVDVLATIVLSIIISKIFNKSFLIVLLCLFILGIILHKLFCVNTTVNKLIFGEV